MLKHFTFKKIAITSLLLLLALILYNYPEEINENIEPVYNKINIYLIDENDFVAMTEINDTSNNNSNNKITNIINSLIIGNNESNLPEGFKAIIPKGTKLLDFNVTDKMIKLNFSKEFLNVSEKDENKMIESIVFSLTSLEEIDKIMIFVEGERLQSLPHSHKKLDLYLDRSYGINKVINISDFHNTSMVTIYYLSKKDDYYFIPVSYVNNSDNDKVEIIINNLKSNRLNSSSLLSYLDYQVELMNYETTEKEVLLDFNDVLLNSVNSGKLKEEVKYAIAYSLSDSLGVKNVVFMVDSVKIDEFTLEKQ